MPWPEAAGEFRRTRRVATIADEDVLQREFGPDLDIAYRADQIAGLKERLQRIVELIRPTS